MRMVKYLHRFFQRGSGTSILPLAPKSTEENPKFSYSSSRNVLVIVTCLSSCRHYTDFKFNFVFSNLENISKTSALLPIHIQKTL